MSENPRAVEGDNSKVGTLDAGQLRKLIGRIESIEAEQEELAEDKRSVFAEVKAQGFDVKTTRRIIRERKKDIGKRQDEQILFDIYAEALGIFA